MGILQVDAHADLRERFEGFDWSHASIFHNVMTRTPGVARLVQVGVRDFGAGEKAFIDGSRGRVRCWFDQEIRSAWERLWSMKYFIKFVYQRDDVWSLGTARDLPVLVGADLEKAEYVWPFGVPYFDAATNRAPIPWEFIVPFTFDERRDVRIITTLIQPRKNGPPLIIDIPQAKGQPELRYELPPLPAPK